MSGWTAEQDLALLLTVIAENPPTKGDWGIISTKFGQGKTAEACRQHYAKLLKKQVTSAENTDNGATETTKTTRGVAKKAPNSRKRKADAVPTEENAGGSADSEGFEGFENAEDVKNTLEAAQAAGKQATKVKAAAAKGAAAKEKAAAKADPKPKASRAKKAKADDGGIKTVKYSPDEGLGGASGEGGQSE